MSEPAPTPMKFPEAAAAIRAARGSRSQQVFATAVGSSMITLRKWERGEWAPQQYLHIVALVDEGVPLSVLRAAAARQVAA